MTSDSPEQTISKPAVDALSPEQRIQHPQKVHTALPGKSLGKGLASARLARPTALNTTASLRSSQPQPSESAPVAPNDSVPATAPQPAIQPPAAPIVVNEASVVADDNHSQREAAAPAAETMVTETPIAQAEVNMVPSETNVSETNVEVEAIVEISSARNTESLGDSQAQNQQAADQAKQVVSEVTEVAEQAAEAELPAEEAAEPETQREELTAFARLGLPASICKQLEKLGYEEPTAIQAATAPLILEGRDVLGQAQTGTGKTAAFALPLLANIDVSSRRPQVLVLCPTRELAMQVAQAFETYASGMKGIQIAAVYGGQSYQPQIQALRRGAQIVVGTPGRVMDHMKQNSLRIDQLQCLVLDEADEMLRMGFVEDVEYVLSHTPDTRQIALFSATMPPAIRSIAEQYLKNPEIVKIQSRQTTADTVSQKYMVVPHHQKFETLSRYIELEDTDGVIVFTRTKVTTVEVAEALNRRGISAAALNGDIAQSMRERTVQQLKDHRVNVLVATDVAARGLDIDRVSHVINYDLPHDSEAYVHRIGRTGRAGRRGVAMLMVTPKETRSLKQLQRQSGNALSEQEMPSVGELNQLRIRKFQERIQSAMEHSEVDFYHKLLTDWLAEEPQDPMRVAAALAAMFNGEQPLLLEELRSRRDRKAKGPSRQFDGYDTYRVAVGKRDRVQAKNIVGAIANESGLAGDDIGRIRIFDSFSLVDLPAGMEDELMATLSETKVGGRPMRLRLGEPEQPAGDRRPGARKGNRSGKFADRSGRKPGGFARSGAGERRGNRGNAGKPQGKRYGKRSGGNG